MLIDQPLLIYLYVYRPVVYIEGLRSLTLTLRRRRRRRRRQGMSRSPLLSTGHKRTVQI